MRKLYKKVFIVVCMLVLSFAFTACKNGNGNGNGKTGDVNSFIMEAEYIELDDIVGAGISSEASGVNMIFGEGTDLEKEKGWSNGYFVGFTYAADLTLNFVFNSDKAETATIIVRLGSEIGDLTFDPLSLAVKLNDTEISYNNIFIPGSQMDAMTFYDKTITTNAQLVEGENVISIVILDNQLMGGQIGAPMVDCIKIKTKAELTWIDKTDNPDRRGEI